MEQIPQPEQLADVHMTPHESVEVAHELAHVAARGEGAIGEGGGGSDGDGGLGAAQDMLAYTVTENPPKFLGSGVPCLDVLP